MTRDPGEDIDLLDGRGDLDVFAPDAVPLRADDPFGDGDTVTDDVIDDDDVVVLSWWQRPVNVLALVVATALIGSMIGWLVADASSERRGNEVDTGFLQDMRYHHEQALTMSFIYLDRPDTSALLRTDARNIIVAQGIDTGRMIQLLRDLNAPEAADPDEPGTAMDWMGDGMAMDLASMPGLASEQQLAELQQADGADADRRFVELMIAHHGGGIEMADYAAEHAGVGEVRALARAMADSQRDEIIEMRRVVD